MFLGVGLHSRQVRYYNVNNTQLLSEACFRFLVTLYY
ncbi:MAG: hypothetical protein ACI9ES_001105 [Oceanospirillaceae bacterium]|jgi:hypothetical protein